MQQTRETSLKPEQVTVLDYGAFAVRDEFAYPLWLLASDKPFGLGELIPKTDRRFVQPDKAVRVPNEVWGTTGEIYGYPVSLLGASARVKDNPKVLGTGLSLDLRAGKTDPARTKQLIEEMVKAATSRWSHGTLDAN